jgi:dsRNA-specific ribonuclease
MSFKDFIFSNLKMAGLAERTYEEIYRLGFEDFRTSFTHKSFRSYNFKDIHELRAQQFSMEELTVSSLKEIDSMKEYNQLEFLGDKQLNTCLAKLLLDEYPDLPDGNLTFAFQKISSERYLSEFAKQHDFFNHILMSPFYYQQAVLWKEGRQEAVDVKIYNKGKIFNVYDKLLEDTCESFAAALVKAVDAYSGVEYGPGMNILLGWTRGIMKLVDFDPRKLEDIKAVGMVMKEMWEDLYAKDLKDEKVKKFANHNMFIIEGKQPGKVPIKAIDPVTRRVVAETVGVSEQDAREKAAKLAVEWLKKNKMSEIEQGRAFKKGGRVQVGLTEGGQKDEYWW